MKWHLTLTLAALFILSCDSFFEDENTCFETFDSPSFWNFSNNGEPDRPDDVLMENGDLIYRYETIEYSNVCVDQKVSIVVSFLRDSIVVVGPTYRAYVDYGFFFEKNVPYFQSYTQDSTRLRITEFKGEIDLSDALSNEPGAFKVVAEVTLPSAGSATRDSANLSDAWKIITTSITYQSK
ncbi:MAG: hypothetical protein KDC24_04120 [Saprospiraceae bacterium]|nr:hypothetical protein [Saprospiraceae bacterium]